MISTRHLAATLLAAAPIHAAAQTVACTAPDQAKARHMAGSDKELLAAIGRPDAGGGVSTARLRQGRRLLGVPFVNFANGYHVEQAGSITRLVVDTTDIEPLRLITLDTPGGPRTLKDHTAIDGQRCDSVPGAVIVTTCHTLTTSTFPLSGDLLQAMADDPRPISTIIIDGIGTTHCAVVAYPREFRLLRQASTR